MSVWIALHDTHVRLDRLGDAPDTVAIARALTRLFAASHFLPDCEQEPDELGQDHCECHANQRSNGL